MIHEIDEAIRRLLADDGVPEGGGELAFDVPTKDWTAKRTAPTVNVFLYDIREDRERRRSGTAEEHDQAGMIVGWRDPPRWYHLSYLVSAWTNRPTDEHRLLSQVLASLSRTDVIAPRWLTGTLAELGLAIPLETAGPVPEGRSVTDVWSTLGGELRPAIDLRVTAPLAGQRAPAGPPVTEGVVMRTGAEEAGRHLRYDGTAALGAGFAGPRERPAPRARRRRTRGGP